MNGHALRMLHEREPRRERKHRDASGWYLYDEPMVHLAIEHVDGTTRILTGPVLQALADYSTERARELDRIAAEFRTVECSGDPRACVWCRSWKPVPMPDDTPAGRSITRAVNDWNLYLANRDRSEIQRAALHEQRVG